MLSRLAISLLTSNINARRITMLDGAQTTAAFDCQKQEKLNLLESVFQAGVPYAFKVGNLALDLEYSLICLTD